MSISAPAVVEVKPDGKVDGICVLMGILADGTVCIYGTGNYDVLSQHLPSLGESLCEDEVAVVIARADCQLSLAVRPAKGDDEPFEASSERGRGYLDGRAGAPADTSGSEEYQRGFKRGREHREATM